MEIVFDKELSRCGSRDWSVQNEYGAALNCLYENTSSQLHANDFAATKHRIGLPACFCEYNAWTDKLIDRCFIYFIY